MVDPSVVDSVAALARLDLDPAQRERLISDLGKILAHIEMLDRVDTTDVPITSHPLDATDVDAADEPIASLPVAEGLRNAPDREGDLFRVPPVLGGDG